MRRLSLAFLVFMIPLGIFAQDDLMNLLNENAPKEIDYATAVSYTHLTLPTKRIV